jgi:hypothetical protein
MRAVSAWIAAALLVWCARARAETTPTVPPMREFPRLRAPPLTHEMQFGIALMPGTGFRSIFPYQDQTFCGQFAGGQMKRVCTGRLPFFLDAEISYGLARRWDVLLDLRFGIEVDFTQTRQFAVAPGFRYWVDPELPVKFFATLQGVLDATDQQNPALQNNDLAVRNANGFMYEVMRNLGLYLQFGETLGFRRWLRFEVDFGLGVQARFP